MAHMIRSGIVEIISLFELQFNLVAQSCLTLCDPMDCSMPDFIVHHQLPELTQTHVHLVGDVIQLSHPLLSPSSLTFNLSQNQGLFKLVSSSHKDFPGASDCKSICLQCGRPGFDLWVGKSPGEGKGYPFQYSGLENPMDYSLSSVQFSRSVVSDSLRPHGPQRAGLAVHCQLLEFTHTPVHRVGDAIQPSHPLSSPSPAFNLCQHQGLSQ